MTRTIVYSDKLVDVFEDGIRLKMYYFPFGDKFILFSDVHSLEKKPLSLLTGKWRLWGSGNLQTWFSLDWYRPKRDAIFFLTLATQKVRIGFSVEHTEKFIAAVKTKGPAAF